MMSKYCVNSDHPAIQGHFPAMPVVPGALILEYVVQSVLENLADNIKISGFSAVKFLMPVLPEQVFQVELVVSGKSKIDFNVVLDKHIAVMGTLNTN